MAGDFSRRIFLQLSAGAALAQHLPARAQTPQPAPFLQELAYGQIEITSPLHRAQIENTHSVLLGLDTDSLLKPFRGMAGQAAPGDTLGGWYEYKPDYNYKVDKAGLAPSATFGQWVSALARHSAASGDKPTADKALLLMQLYAKTITPEYYKLNRFPTYCYDKLVCALMDTHRLLQDPNAFPLLDRTTDAAVQVMPGHAVDREVPWRPDHKGDISWDWDESYTIPENLYLVYALGAGKRYLAMAEAYLDDETYFDPLSRNVNVLGHKHAYSYVNALCSAMQAYMVGGSRKHLDAARNAFDMLEEQSFATGGWGPDELLRKPGTEQVYASLIKSHNSFETPCGSYAHMKLTRYLLRVTRDGRYGDSMERVMYNTVLGAKRLQPDGHAFYYSDYNYKGKRVFSDHIWPCCSGTLPQVAADYGINSYFREPGAIWVNLYIPSILRWSEGSTQMELAQTGDYPYADTVELRVKAATPAAFTLHLRIPAWAENPRLLVNGKAAALVVTTGFAQLSRTWQNGDTIALELPSKPRLQSIDRANPQVAAVLQGPLVLFAKTHTPPSITRKQALAASRAGRTEWTIASGAGPVRLSPFVDLDEAPYTTYLELS